MLAPWCFMRAPSSRPHIEGWSVTAVTRTWLLARSPHESADEPNAVEGFHPDEVIGMRRGNVDVAVPLRRELRERPRERDAPGLHGIARPLHAFGAHPAQRQRAPPYPRTH